VWQGVLTNQKRVSVADRTSASRASTMAHPHTVCLSSNPLFRPYRGQ